MTIKRYALLLTMALALIAGFGCSKTEGTGTDGSGSAITPEMQAAMDTITNQKIFFEFDRYDIRADSQEVLKAKANALRSYPSIRIQIQGNCDERGTQEYNLALGERRARASYEYLVTLGVNPSQLEMISYGKENPAVQGNNEAAWSKNRRDDFRVVAH